MFIRNHIYAVYVLSSLLAFIDLPSVAKVVPGCDNLLMAVLLRGLKQTNDSYANLLRTLFIF